MTELKQQYKKLNFKVLPAKLWRDDIRNKDIVDPTEEGSSNNHQYEHKSKKQRPKSTHIVTGCALSSLLHTD